MCDRERGVPRHLISDHVRDSLPLRLARADAAHTVHGTDTTTPPRRKINRLRAIQYCFEEISFIMSFIMMWDKKNGMHAHN